MKTTILVLQWALFLLAFPFLALGNNLRMAYLHARAYLKGKK